MDFKQQFQQQSRQVEEIAKSVEAEVSSDDSAVRVIVGAGGSIKDMELTHRAFQKSGAELGELIVDTLRKAERRVQEEMSSRMSEVFGRTISPDDLGRRPQDD